MAWGGPPAHRDRTDLRTDLKDLTRESKERLSRPNSLDLNPDTV
jgi:hypothetical protein